MGDLPRPRGHTKPRLPGTAPSPSAGPEVENDLVRVPPGPPAPPRPKRWSIQAQTPPQAKSEGPGGLMATTPTTLEPVESSPQTLVGFQLRAPILEVLLQTSGSSFCNIRTLPSTSREVRSYRLSFVGLDCWPPSFRLLAEASLRMIECKLVKRPWSPKLLMPGDEEPRLARPTVFQKSVTLAARCCHLRKKMSHHSVVECYPLCSFSDLDCVALATVIHFEQTSTLSPGIYTNTYQLSFYTDSDIMTALWTTRVAESHRVSKIPVSGSDLPPPCGCPSRPEGTAPCHVAPHQGKMTVPHR